MEIARTLEDRRTEEDDGSPGSNSMVGQQEGQDQDELDDDGGERK